MEELYNTSMLRGVKIVFHTKSHNSGSFVNKSPAVRQLSGLLVEYRPAVLQTWVQTRGG